MYRRFALVFVALLVFTLAPAAFAARSTPGKCTMWNNYSTVLLSDTTYAGVSNVGDPMYANGSVERLECSFSVNRGVVNFVTYQTGRKLHFNLDPVVAAKAGIPSSFDAEVDLFGINYYGKFENMAVGTTAQVQADLEFYVGRETFELDYPAIAVKRTGENTWLFTTDHARDIEGDPGFQASSTAKLNVIRRRSQTFYGEVQAPIRFEVTLP